jgi:hypothetical protein
VAGLALCVVVLLIAGCTTAHQSIAARTVVGPRWVLIRNPGFGSTLDEREYIWVEDDKVPTTITTLRRGRSAIIATPDVVAKYGPPPSDASPRPTATVQEHPIRRCGFQRKTRIPIIHPVTGEIVGELESDLKAAPEPCWPDY